MKSLKLAILVALLLSLPEEMSATSEVAVKADVKKALQWFPADTETIAVARGFTLRPSPSEEDGEAVVRPLLDSIQWITAFGFYSVQEAKSVDFFQDLRVRVGIQGARKFRITKGFGMVLFDGASILFIEEGQKEERDRMLSEIARSASEVLEIEGVKVLRFEEEMEEDIWSFYLASPDEETLIMATNEVYLNQTLSNRKNPSETRALPQSLPEWQFVDSSAPFWAIHHFSQVEVDKNPTSPYTDNASGMSADSGAVGFVSIVESSSEAKSFYLSTDLNAVKNRALRISQLPTGATIEYQLGEGSEGVHFLEQHYGANLDAEDKLAALITMLWYLGFGIFL